LDIHPSEVVRVHRYTTRRPDPSETAVAAVIDVFMGIASITDEPIEYFYSPAELRRQRLRNLPEDTDPETVSDQSDWHETQRFVMVLGGHRFFAPWGA
jgi:hypothetical protein